MLLRGKGFDAKTNSPLFVWFVVPSSNVSLALRILLAKLAFLPYIYGVGHVVFSVI
ncbi:hypothetical protein HMPREF1991_01900 [Hoylesella loescheii DSM 19665 = JCM 12249 = ATCC 15930]|uniref:Uncharacterized protein n=1 Tax=Hoylesella loescheii DSM 19665 = JCM 12249 = ATCC 15930 TaxID=1122985 RepID=A0A069QGW1_HOYLO|nr:hypothetical protein HMPREF1991_01900 [Hoylesella loescheii DSM 19665 = JCM 12249 = ATCC 15930]